MKAAKLQTIHIPAQRRRRSGAGFWVIVGLVIAALGGAIFLAKPWAEDSRYSEATKQPSAGQSVITTEAADKAANALAIPKKAEALKPQDGVLLTLSGYIVNRERIELSPRVMNEVRWIGVKKGDRVKKGQVVVQLDDAEQKARVAELEAQIAVAKVALERSKLQLGRVLKLRATQNETPEREDEARLAVASAEAQIQQLEAARDSAKVWLDWTVIRSPIDGVVLEKLADPGELVTPQSFGGGRGPSTALLSLADPNDLQVEVDISESNLGKIRMNQRCLVSPEAFLEKTYEAYVAEIAPEANRQKGTLQVKVQIKNPDLFLTPELSAKVQFLE